MRRSHRKKPPASAAPAAAPEAALSPTSVDGSVPRAAGDVVAAGAEAAAVDAQEPEAAQSSDAPAPASEPDEGDTGGPAGGPPPGLTDAVLHANPWSLAMALLVVVLAVILSRQAKDELDWSDWGFGDAQTLLSSRQWSEGGWIASKLLFNPQGYAAVMTVVDDPALRHHAHGTHSGGIGSRRLYTHYPPGYLVPYAILYELGFEGAYPAKLLSIALSLLGLVFMYVAFAAFSSRPVAFLATLLYALSTCFMRFAYTIANQPADDVLRFLFMWTVVRSTRDPDPARRRRWMIGAWAVEFTLALFSLDSVFFVWVWLVGWHAYERRRMPWKIGLVYGLAPAIGHGLLLVQNAWYLGLDVMMEDFRSVIAFKSASTVAGDFGTRMSVQAAILANHLLPFFDTKLAIAAVTTCTAGRAWATANPRVAVPAPYHLAVLFVAGSVFPLLLPLAGDMSYQSRQLAPFCAALGSAAVWSLVWLGRSFAQATARMLAWAGAVALLVLTVRHVTAFDPPRPYSRQFMTGNPALKRMIELARDDLSRMETRYEPVFFSAGGLMWLWDFNYDPKAPQIHPVMEYYVGNRPILCFRSPEIMAEDLAYMLEHGGARFSPVLVASDPAGMQATLAALGRTGILDMAAIETRNLGGAPVADLTAAIPWDRFPALRDAPAKKR